MTAARRWLPGGVLRPSSEPWDWRAPALVLDVQNAYFDRLLLTPVRRTAILFGHMAADVAVAAALTTSYVPLSQLSGWPGAVARVNPVTYLLGGLRSLVLAHGLQWDQIGQALVAIVLVGTISMTLCFATLRGRIKRG